MLRRLLGRIVPFTLTVLFVTGIATAPSAFGQLGVTEEITDSFYQLTWPQLDNHGNVMFHAKRTSGDSFQVYRYDADTGQVTRLTDGPGASYMGFLNDRGDYTWRRETAPGSYRYNGYLTRANGETLLLYDGDSGSNVPGLLNGLGDAVWVRRQIIDGRQDTRAYLYTADDGQVRAITDNSTWVTVSGINDARQVVVMPGGYPSSVALYDSLTGTLTTLASGATNYGSPKLNNRGEVAYTARRYGGQEYICTSGWGGTYCGYQSYYVYDLNLWLPETGETLTLDTQRDGIYYFELSDQGDVVWQWREDYTYDFELSFRDGPTGAVFRLTDNNGHDQLASFDSNGDLVWISGGIGAQVRLADTGEVFTVPAPEGAPYWYGMDYPRINNNVTVVGLGGSGYNDRRIFRYTHVLPNTPDGADVAVQPVDGTTGEPAPLSLTFDSVLQGGDTTLTSSTTGAGAPPDFRLGNPPVYYDITTTAVFDGSVEVCLTYDETAFRRESRIRLFHGEGGVWVDVTTSLDTDANVICGSVTSLSPFAAFEYNVIGVALDIKPGSDANPVNLGSRGSVPAAVLGSADFDVTRIDGVSVTLAGAPVRTRGGGVPQANLEDVNEDGLPDLVLHFDTPALNLSAGDTQATLEGLTADGTIVRGTDAVQIVP